MKSLTEQQRHAIGKLLRVPSNLPENAKHNNLVIDLVLAFLRNDDNKEISDSSAGLDGSVKKCEVDNDAV